MSSPSDRVLVFDTTLRDGEQSAGVCFSRRDKLEIAERLEALRVDVIEAGFPASGEVECAAVAAVAARVREARVCALARCVPGDVDAAGRALARAARSRIHVFVNSSEVQLAQQLRKSREDVLGMAEAAVRRARRFTDDVEFSPMDATRADPEFVAEIVRVALAAGARTINLPDTVGYARPDQVQGLVAGVGGGAAEAQEAGGPLLRRDQRRLAPANRATAVAA